MQANNTDAFAPAAALLPTKLAEAGRLVRQAHETDRDADGVSIGRVAVDGYDEHDLRAVAEGARRLAQIMLLDVTLLELVRAVVDLAEAAQHQAAREHCADAARELIVMPSWHGAAEAADCLSQATWLDAEAVEWREACALLADALLWWRR